MKDFDWGWMSSNPQNRMRRLIEEEFFTSDTNIYEKIFKVQEGDVVLDLGASIGPFPYAIKHKNPSKIFCVEASKSQFPVLLKNTKDDNVVCINKAIWNEDGPAFMEQVYGEPDSDSEIPTFLTPQYVEGIKFSTLIKEYNIDRIDFLKADCEGGEYDVFNSENIWWIKDNMKKIAGEWHLSNPQLKEKFREFRDTYLRLFPNHQIYSVDGVDIKWSLWSEKFIEYYNEVIIYIDNR